MPELIIWVALLAAALLLFRRFVLVPYRQAQERRRKELEADKTKQGGTPNWSEKGKDASGSKTLGGMRMPFSHQLSE